MDWLTLIIISLVTFSLATIFQKSILKDSKINEVLYSIVFQLTVALIYLFIGLFITGMSFEEVRGYEINVVIMVLLYAAANLFGFMAVKGMDASKYIVILTLRGLITVIASSLVLGEFLIPIQWLGAVLIIISSVIVTIDSPEKLKFKFNKFEILAFVTAICFGLANTNDRILLDQAGINVVPYMVLAFVFPPIIMMVVRPSALRDLKKYSDKKEIIRTVVFAILVSVSAGTLFAAFAATQNSSQVASVNLLSTILIVILGIVVLKERDGILRKIIGTIVALIGLFLVI